MGLPSTSTSSAPSRRHTTVIAGPPHATMIPGASDSPAWQRRRMAPAGPLYAIQVFARVHYQEPLLRRGQLHGGENVERGAFSQWIARRAGQCQGTIGQL